MIRIFSFKTGKLLRLLNETFEHVEKVQESEETRYKLLQLEAGDMERRKLNEKEIVKQK